MKTFACLACSMSMVLPCGRMAFAADDGSSAAQLVRAKQAYGQLALSFTANQGQADPRVAFVSQGSGYAIALGREKAEVTLVEQGRSLSRPAARVAGQQGHGLAPELMPAPEAVLHLSLPGSARVSSVTGVEEQEGKSNYLIGPDPTRWHTGVPNYGKVRYAGVYPGVDMVYYGTQREMEFDFVVAPHAEPGKIRLAFEGTIGSKSVHMAVNADGDLVTTGDDSRVLLHKPVVFQTASNGTRESVASSFAMDGTEVRVRLGAYDHSRELVIDPKLVYATLLGPTASQFDVAYANGMAVDPAGSIYVTGTAFATWSFPVTPGAFQTTTAEPVKPYNGGVNTFVSKMNATGTALVYSTYLNPSNQLQDAAQSTSTGVAVNAAGNAYITGIFQDLNNKETFPTTPGAFKRNIVLHNTGFVTELTADGSGLVFSTLLGDFTAVPSAIALDSKLNVIIAGKTQYGDIVTTSGVLQPMGDPKTTAFADQGYLTKLNANGTKLVFSTYLGPPGTYPHAIVVDRADNMYVAGNYQVVSSEVFPTTPGAYDATPNSSFPGFVMKVNPTASQLLDSTLLLGTQEVDALAIDQAGAAYLTGFSENADLPATPGAYQTVCEDQAIACYDAFVLKLNPTFTALDYATYLGGNPPVDESDGYPEASTHAYGIAVDSSGDAYVVGETDYDKYPTTAGAYLAPNPKNVLFGGAFLTELDPAGNALRYSTLLGSGIGIGIVLDSSRNAYIAGNVESGDMFPTSPGAYQHSFPGGGLFLVKFSFGESFCSFAPQVQVDASATRVPGFAAAAQFALPKGESIDPTTVPVTVTIAGRSVTVPAGKLLASNGMYSFSGVVNGTAIYLQLEKLATSSGGCGTGYSLFVSDRSTTFVGVTNPVDVMLSIGDYTGEAEVQANILQ